MQKAEAVFRVTEIRGKTVHGEIVLNGIVVAKRKIRKGSDIEGVANLNGASQGDCFRIEIDLLINILLIEATTKNI